MLLNQQKNGNVVKTQTFKQLSNVRLPFIRMIWFQVNLLLALDFKCRIVLIY